MGLTVVTLHRLGNAATARLDHVRPRDIQHYDVAGVAWVQAGTGGVSTFDTVGRMAGHWWKLDAGYDHGSLLLVWNDHANHWSWEPVADMLLDDYRSLLTSAGLAFHRLP